MTALLVLLISAGVPEEEGEVRGATGGPAGNSTWHQRAAPIQVPAEVAEARRAVRLRAGVGAALLGGFSYYQPSGGLGLTLEGGLTFGDRLALFVHGELGTFVFTLIGSGGLVGEYALGEQWSLGGGAMFTAWAPTGSYGSARFIGFTFPVRLSYAITLRAASATHRTGLLLSWQLAPGFSLIAQNPFLQPGPQPVQAAVTSTVSAGFGWW